MVRALNLLDIPLVYSLRGLGTFMDLEGVLRGTHRPLLSALAGYFSIPQAGVATYVLVEEVDGQPLRGFIQGQAEGAECDVLFISPALGSFPYAERIWRALLEHFCVRQGQSGVQHIFAKAPDDQSAAAETLRQLGFGAYARRHAFRLASMPPGEGPAVDAGLRPRRPEDAWGLQRLYATVTPRPIQQAEGFDRQAEGPAARAPYGLGRGAARDWVAAREGEIVAYFRPLSGRWGHWLKAILHPELGEEAAALVEAALGLFRGMPPRPLYCGVREYEVALKNALLEVGFQPFADELLMVKHTTARVEVPAFELAPDLEKKAQRLPTASETRGQR